MNIVIVNHFESDSNSHTILGLCEMALTYSTRFDPPTRVSLFSPWSPDVVKTYLSYHPEWKSLLIFPIGELSDRDLALHDIVILPERNQWVHKYEKRHRVAYVDKSELIAKEITLPFHSVHSFISVSDKNHWIKTSAHDKTNMNFLDKLIKSTSSLTLDPSATMDESLRSLTPIRSSFVSPPIESTTEELNATRLEYLQSNVNHFASLQNSTTSNPFHIDKIHQIWVSNNPVLFNNVPFRYDAYRAEWSRLNPKLEYKLWNEPDILQLIKDHYDEEIFHTYETMRPLISQCDFARLLIVFICGGLYVDADFIPLKPISRWTPVYDASGLILFTEISEHSNEFRMINGCFAAEYPRNPFIWELINEVVEIRMRCTGDTTRVMETTGPAMLTRVFKRKWGTPEQPLNYPIPYVQKGCYVMPLTDHHKLSNDFNGHAGGAWCFTMWTEGSGWGAGENSGVWEPKKTENISLNVDTNVQNPDDPMFIAFWVVMSLLIVVLLGILVRFSWFKYRKSHGLKNGQEIS